MASAEQHGSRPLHQVWGGLELSDEDSDSHANQGKAPPAVHELGLQFLENSASSETMVSHTGPSNRTSEQAAMPEQGGEGCLPTEEAEAAELIGGGSEAEELASVGSRLHAAKQCTPCHFMNAPSGCRNGINCLFCHEHNKQGSKKQTKRSKARAVAGQALSYQRSIIAL